MDNKYVDALMVALIAFGILMSVAGIFIGIITVMHKGMSSAERYGGFKLRRVVKKTGKDKKRNVVIAAAVASYLKAEEEHNS